LRSFPAKTPTPIVKAMQELLNETLKVPNVTETMARASFEPLNYSGEQLDALQRADSAQVRKLVGPAPT
jgi:tripartite-type tricarboxylate transporter receptor subunit TctC